MPIDERRNGIVEIEIDIMEIEEGDDVVGSDGEKLGHVIGRKDDYIVVEKGFFFPTDYFIPASAIASVEDDKVVLTVSKDEALDQGWDVVPGDETVGTPGGAFLTGATSYDEEVGIDRDGEPITDADLRSDPEFTGDDADFDRPLSERV